MKVELKNNRGTSPITMLILKNISSVFKSIAIAVFLFHASSFAADIKSDKAAECFKRAEMYYEEAHKYGNDIRDPSKWFVLAMENYLCAAKAGNAFAMWRVATLSRSEQAEPLSKQAEDQYFLQAAEAGLAVAQIGLAKDYCDNIGTKAPCKNAKEAEKWLLRAARNGSASGAFVLGVLYERETNDEITARMTKALACYQLSRNRFQAGISVIDAKDSYGQKSGLEVTEMGIARTQKILGRNNSSGKCY